MELAIFAQEAKNGHPCAIASCGDGPRGKEEMEMMVLLLLLDRALRPWRRIDGWPHDDTALG